MQDLTQIGYTKKTYGVRGQLRVYVEGRYEEALLQAEALFLEIDGQPVPYFIETIERNGDTLLKLEEIDVREAAQPLTGKPLYLRTADLPAAPVAATTDYTLLVGYTLVDQEQGPVGFIAEVLVLPEQYLALIDRGGAEVLAPLHPDLIVEIDPEGRRLLMRLPEGLL